MSEGCPWVLNWGPLGVRGHWHPDERGGEGGEGGDASLMLATTTTAVQRTEHVCSVSEFSVARGHIEATLIGWLQLRAALIG